VNRRVSLKGLKIDQGRMKPITEPDVENQSQDYWEKVLLSHGLGLRRGESTKASLRGGISDLVIIEELIYTEESGRVQPKGAAPES